MQWTISRGCYHVVRKIDDFLRLFEARQEESLQTANSSKLTCALNYARHGIKVFPVFEIKQDGECACGKPNCPAKGKHPRIKDWQPLATANEAEVRAGWGSYPSANLGVTTGLGSNLTVLDVDGQEGAATLHELEVNTEGCSELPSTPRVKTGGKGGHQYYFQHVPGMRNSPSHARAGRFPSTL